MLAITAGISIIGAIVTAYLLVSAARISRQTKRYRTRHAVIDAEIRCTEKMLDRTQFIPTHHAIEHGYQPPSTPSSKMSHPINKQ